MKRGKICSSDDEIIKWLAYLEDWIGEAATMELSKRFDEAQKGKTNEQSTK